MTHQPHGRRTTEARQKDAHNAHPVHDAVDDRVLAEPLEVHAVRRAPRGRGALALALALALAWADDERAFLDLGRGRGGDGRSRRLPTAVTDGVGAPLLDRRDDGR